MNRVTQVYATVVCIIAIITMLITLANLVSGYIDKNDPMHSGWQSDNLSSFENFKMQTMKGISDNQAYIPDDEELMKMYESAKQDKLETAEHRINRNLTVNRLILVIAVVLFIIHWIMMRRAMKASNS
jgi:hypothetical protein